jgi:uncharacterized protein (UPF0262 family)
VKDHRDEEIERLTLIIRDYAQICKSYSQEIASLKHRLAAIDTSVKQKHEASQSGVV